LVKPLLVIGSNGQLARAFKQLCPDALFLDRRIADLSQPDQLAEALERYDARAVINTAAYTQVDNAESEEAFATVINAQSPAAMAIYCTRRSIPLVHFSTDYVMNGSGDTAWKEDDAPAPLNAYGRSKLAGEDAIAHIGGSYLIFRTSWMYDAQGKNFLNTILRLVAERSELRIINDQFGAPTYAQHLAAAVLEALDVAIAEQAFPSGIYHLCNRGVTTWYGFATSIVEHARRTGLPVKVRTIYPISSSEYPLPAKRPLNSRLDCSKALSMFGVSLPDWQEGLKACMEQKRENH
jgi:dTDP-4-dehydrorhamnose reductase